MNQKTKLLENQIIEREQARLKKFQIKYYYLATGMEGIPDVYPIKQIEAPTKDLAVYIYYLMFFAETDVERLETMKRENRISDFAFESYYHYLHSDSKDWGISIKEI